MRDRLFWLVCLSFFVCLAVPEKSAAQASLTCESQNGQRQYCAADTRGGVGLVRQLSQSPCIQNQTWGWDGRGIWVDRGCRAEFRLSSNPAPAPGPPGSVTCESNNNLRQNCRIDTRRGVRLVQQLSQAPCIQHRTWGYAHNMMWVSSGCRGVFAPGGGPGGPGPGIPAPVPITNYPRVRVDTSGRGQFNSRTVNIRVTRGFVDTSAPQTSVALRGSEGLITFYGVIEQANGDREFTMRITGSDRGNAQGQARFRFNGDRNEVEMITVNGRLNGSNFNGSFSR